MFCLGVTLCLNPCVIFEEHYEGTCHSDNQKRSDHETEGNGAVRNCDKEDEAEDYDCGGEDTGVASEETKCILHFCNLSYGALLP